MGSPQVRPEKRCGFAHSLGDYPALHVAGMLSAARAIFIFDQRAWKLEKRKIGGHKTLTVRASPEDFRIAIDSLRIMPMALAGSRKHA